MNNIYTQIIVGSIMFGVFVYRTTLDDYSFSRAKTCIDLRAIES